MNKNQKNMVNPGENIITEILRNQLKRILDDLRNGVIPEEKSLKELSQSFTEYRNECEKRIIDSTAYYQSEKIMDSDSFVFSDAFYNEKDNIGQLKFILDADYIPLLKELAMKKVIFVENAEEFENSISDFLKEELIAMFTVYVNENEVSGYCLTTKGWSWLLSEEIFGLLKTEDVSFDLSDYMCLPPSEWSDTEFKQAAIIRTYYDSEDTEEYFLFRDYDEPGLLMGCRVQDSPEINYCVVIEFDEEKEIKNCDRICEVAKSHKIDNLTVIVLSDEEEQLFKQYCERTQVAQEKLRFYNMTEVYGQ